MTFIVLAILCSVSVSVLLKLAPRRGLDLSAMILWNYVAAGTLCMLLLRPQVDLAHPHPLALLLGLVLPALFLIMGRAVGSAGIVRADIAQRMSLLLSGLAAFVLFHDHPTPWKIAGLALGLLAMLGILARSGPQGKGQQGGALGWLLAVWCGYAAVDVLLKLLALDGAKFPPTLLLAFGVALAGMAAVQLLRRNAAALRAPDIAAGLGLGLLNFGNIYFYIRAHQALAADPAVVFTAMNVGVVLLAAVVGVFALRERTSALNRASIALAAGAILVLAYAA